MMQIKISVVVPTYNRSFLLKNCLHNLIHQTLCKDEYEIIIVSDGPDEITKQLVLEAAGFEQKNKVFFLYHTKKARLLQEILDGKMQKEL